MLKKTLYVPIVLLMLSCLSFGFQDTTWSTFNSPEGRFSALMPTKPKIEVRDVDSKVGKITLYSYTSSNNVAYFHASYGDYPQEPTPGTLEAVLDGVRNGVVQGLQAELLDEKKITLGGFAGRELTAKRIVDGNEVRFKWRMYIVGRRLYQLAAATSKADAESPDVAKFLTSFQVTK